MCSQKVVKRVHPYHISGSTIYSAIESAKNWLDVERISNDITPGTLTHASQRLLDEIQKFQSQQEKVTLHQLLSENQQPAMQGSWRRNPFPERQYDFLTDNVPCSSHEDCCSELLSCDKPNGFYNSTPSTGIELNGIRHHHLRMVLYQ